MIWARFSYSCSPTKMRMHFVKLASIPHNPAPVSRMQAILVVCTGRFKASRIKQSHSFCSELVLAKGRSQFANHLTSHSAAACASLGPINTSPPSLHGLRIQRLCYLRVKGYKGIPA